MGRKLPTYFTMSGLLSTICGKVFPDRTKRLMLYAALTGIINNKGPEIEEKHLIMLNSRFSLAYRIDALKLPLLIRDSILPNLSIRRDVNRVCDYKQLAKDTYSKIPSWLIYNCENEIITELMSYFEFEFHCSDDPTILLH